MLIIYKRATGEVVENTGTNSALPEGPLGDGAYRNTDARGIARGGLALLRLHDERDRTTVEKTFTHAYHVEKGKVVFDGQRPAPEPPPPAPDPLAELTARVEALEAQLAQSA
jgi:hypothetical protein